MSTVEESEFLKKIDCKFPYDNREKIFLLIDEAEKISTNALFAIVEEICRIPASKKKQIGSTELLEMLNLTSIKINHPLKFIILDTAKNIIQDQFLTVEEAIARMKLVKKYPEQFHALNIIYFSCDDIEDRLE